MRRIIILAFIMTLSLTSASCGTSQDKKDMAIAKYKLGQSELQAGKTQQAFVRFHEALIQDPRNREVHHALGYVNMSMGDYKEAEKHLMRAVSLDNQYSEAWNSICSLYHIYLGKYDKALRACEKALENPLYATPEKSFYNIARIYYKKGNNSKSLANAGKAIKRFPNWFPAYYIQSLAYNGLGKYNEASESLDTAIGLDPRFQGNKKKAENYFKKNRKKKAFFETPQEADLLVEILHY
jgi:tetratricopeptide (TPR) repeat protein